MTAGSSSLEETLVGIQGSIPEEFVKSGENLGDRKGNKGETKRKVTGEEQGLC